MTVLERQEVTVHCVATVWCPEEEHASAATPVDALIVVPIPIQHLLLATIIKAIKPLAVAKTKNTSCLKKRIIIMIMEEVV